jgi:site-specific recombinase XerD
MRTVESYLQAAKICIIFHFAKLFRIFFYLKIFLENKFEYVRLFCTFVRKSKTIKKMSFNPKNYQFSAGKHENKSVIFVRFQYNSLWHKELKEKFKSAKWCASEKFWYLPDNNAIRNAIGMEPKSEMGKAVICQIHPVNYSALERMREMLLLKAYSPNTIKTYCNEFAQLLYLLKNVPVDTLTPERLRSYLLYCTTTLKLSENVIHSRMNAIKFYFEQVLRHDKMFFEGIPRPKKKEQLPKVFGKNDIIKLFSQIKNPKHLLMIKLCYGMGLRVSEIVNLKISNIDSQRMLVHIESAKGKKDRYVTLPTSILDSLRNYYLTFHPKIYLFEGRDGRQYSIRSVQAVFENAMQKAKINKTVGIHGLRHSYATHLLESGTDMIFIQKLLGHKDIKTTEIYAKVSKRHISNIKSPLDDF